MEEGLATALEETLDTVKDEVVGLAVTVEATVDDTKVEEAAEEDETTAEKRIAAITFVFGTNALLASFM